MRSAIVLAAAAGFAASHSLLKTSGEVINAMCAGNKVLNTEITAEERRNILFDIRTKIMYIMPRFLQGGFVWLHQV